MVKNPLWFLFLLFGFISCHDRPTFPFTPYINFRRILFSDNYQKILVILLIIKIEFEDGDGDLGLQSDETNPPTNCWMWL